MSIEHLSINGGGAEFVPFARSKIKGLRAAGLKYASRQYEIEGVTIRIRIVMDIEFIAVGIASVVVAMLYESEDNYMVSHHVPWTWEIGDPPIVGAVNVYAVFATGSRKLLGAGTYEWVPLGINFGGYEPEPGNLISPAKLNTPYLDGTPARYAGETLDGELALYLTDEDRIGDINGITVDVTQSMSVDVWQAYEMNFALRALTTDGNLIPPLVPA